RLTQFKQLFHTRFDMLFTGTSYKNYMEIATIEYVFSRNIAYSVYNMECFDIPFTYRYHVTSNIHKQSNELLTSNTNELSLFRNLIGIDENLVISNFVFPPNAQ
ncbi:hypothetical protein L9F63_013050, partial [Diploptera punctata]